MAWDAPLAPTGYIGWAASPSRVIRPDRHRGSGSRSTMGYCHQRAAASIRGATSIQPKRIPENSVRASAGSATWFQSWRGIGRPAAVVASSTMLIRAHPSRPGLVIG